MQDYFSVKETADYLDVDLSLVRSLLNCGWLRGEKLERVWRVPADALLAFQSRVSGAAEWKADSRGEFLLARSGRCPVCAGELRRALGRSSLAAEFFECPDCSLSLHDSLIENETDLSESVSLHGQKLQQMEIQGQKVRNLLARRQFELQRTPR